MAIMFEIEDNNTIISIPLDKENTVISRDYYYGDKVGGSFLKSTQRAIPE